MLKFTILRVLSFAMIVAFLLYNKVPGNIYFTTCLLSIIYGTLSHILGYKECLEKQKFEKGVSIE